MKQYGSLMMVEEAVQEISKDEIFFFHSEGGVTISGGEPLNQTNFVAQVLRACRERGINTAMETSLYAPFERVEGVLPWLNTLYVDIKHMDTNTHKKWVGTGNALILENICKVDQSNYPINMVIRIPLVPGINDTDANLTATARFAQSLNKLKEVELLPYHRLGIETYKNLDLDYSLRHLTTSPPEHILERATYLSNQDPHISVRVGGGFAE
jgi:pyruvate formate lyase activating enzyme